MCVFDYSVFTLKKKRRNERLLSIGYRIFSKCLVFFQKNIFYAYYIIYTPPPKHTHTQ